MQPTSSLVFWGLWPSFQHWLWGGSPGWGLSRGVLRSLCGCWVPQRPHLLAHTSSDSPPAAQPEPQRRAGQPGEAARQQHLHGQGPAQVGVGCVCGAGKETHAPWSGDGVGGAPRMERGGCFLEPSLVPWASRDLPSSASLARAASGGRAVSWDLLALPGLSPGSWGLQVSESGAPTPCMEQELLSEEGASSWAGEQGPVTPGSHLLGGILAGQRSRGAGTGHPGGILAGQKGRDRSLLVATSCEAS